MVRNAPLTPGLIAALIALGAAGVRSAILESVRPS